MTVVYEGSKEHLLQLGSYEQITTPSAFDPSDPGEMLKDNGYGEGTASYT